jgi:uncharacterized membrane protein
MKDKKMLMKAAIGGVVSLGLTMSSGIALSSGKDRMHHMMGGHMEKCYGIAKAGKNDCGIKGHSCQGLSKVDSDPNDYIKLPKGTCDRIVGGSTVAGAEKSGTQSQPSSMQSSPQSDTQNQQMQQPTNQQQQQSQPQ